MKSARRSRTERRHAEQAERRAERRRQAAATHAPRERPLPNVPLLVPALAGTALAGYLTVVALLGAAPAACGVGSACSLVQSSRFASFAGIPTAGWGLVAYAGLVAVSLRLRGPRTHWVLALGLSGVALAVSLYLTAVSMFEIGATCAWCLASLGLVAACFGVALLQRPQLPVPLNAGRWLGAIPVVSALLVGGLHLHYQGALDPTRGPEDPQLRALALHLKATGVRFYGASWCPNCVDQKEIFGGAARHLPYVECSTAGPGSPQTRVCRDAGIRNYPTWIIGGERLVGMLPASRLAQLSGFSGSTSPISELRDRPHIASERVARLPEFAARPAYDQSSP